MDKITREFLMACVILFSLVFVMLGLFVKNTNYILIGIFFLLFEIAIKYLFD